MKYRDLRDFIRQLEAAGELKRITTEIDPYLEMTEICDRTLRAGGPALLFENPRGHSVPVLANLFVRAAVLSGAFLPEGRPVCLCLSVGTQARRSPVFPCP